MASGRAGETGFPAAAQAVRAAGRVWGEVDLRGGLRRRKGPRGRPRQSASTGPAAGPISLVREAQLKAAEDRWMLKNGCLFLDCA
jgi:hypothetical protein